MVAAYIFCMDAVCILDARVPQRTDDTSEKGNVSVAGDADGPKGLISKQEEK
jgi:hypothetical protein